MQQPSNFCLVCGHNPCTCGSMYQSAQESDLILSMVRIMEELRSRGHSLTINIDDQDIVGYIEKFPIRPVFDDRTLLYLASSHVPPIWQRTIQEHKTLIDLINYLRTQSEEQFPLIGLFYTILLLAIYELKRIPLSSVMVLVLYTYFQREDTILELLNSSNDKNYDQIIPKLRTVIDLLPDSDMEKYPCQLLYEELLDAHQGSSSVFDSFRSIFLLTQWVVFNDIRDNSSDIKKYIDEFYYLDESLVDKVRQEVDVQSILLPYGAQHQTIILPTT